MASSLFAADAQALPKALDSGFDCYCVIFLAMSVTLPPLPFIFQSMSITTLQNPPCAAQIMGATSVRAKQRVGTKKGTKSQLFRGDVLFGRVSDRRGRLPVGPMRRRLMRRGPRPWGRKLFRARSIPAHRSRMLLGSSSMRRRVPLASQVERNTY